MRVGLVVAPWLPVPPHGYGGIETVVDHLARGLQDAGHEVLLCASGDSTCPVSRAEGMMDATHKPGFGPHFEAAHVIDAHQTLYEWEADIIHDHSMIGPLIGLYGTPIVTTNHTTFDRSMNTIYRSADYVVAISHSQALTATVPVAAVIHHGIDVDQLPVGDGSGGYALFLGRFDACKGVHVAIEAARAAGVPLVIAAKEPNNVELAYFRSEVKPRLGVDVQWVGEVTGAQKSELLGNAVCLLNPIQWPEPFGMVMIEALAHGTPVVTTPMGAAPEIVDNARTGIICHNTRVLGFALQDVDLLDRAVCRKVAEERFSTATMVAAHVRLYERIIG